MSIAKATIEYPRAVRIKSIDSLDDTNPPQYVITSPSGRWWQVSLAVCALLHLMDGQKSLTEIASQAKSRYRINIPEDKLRKLVLNELLPKGLVIDPTTKTKKPPRQRNGLVRLPFLPSRVVAAVANRLKAAFHPLLAFPLLLVAITVHGLFYATCSFEQLTHHVTEQYEYVYLGLAFLGIFHEFGHAAASAYYDNTPGPIGFGMFYFMPVWWSDVSETWVLVRRQRIVVDLGGLYFSLLGATALILAFWGSNRAVASLSTIAVYVDLSLFFNLSPLMRLDGYWFLADVLGIPNLHQTLYTTMKQLLHLRKPSIHNRLTGLQRWLFYGYCTAWFVAMPFLTFFVGRQLWSITLDYPLTVSKFLQNLLPTDNFVFWSAQWIHNLIRLLMVPMFYWVIGRKLFHWLISKKQGQRYDSLSSTTS